MTIGFGALGCSNQAQETESPPTETVETTDTTNVDDVLSSLKGLSIDAFFEESFNQLSLRAPEGLTHAGVSHLFGLRDDQLNNLSSTYLKDTQKLEAGILDLLQVYDRQSLTTEQAVSYDVYVWY